MNKMAGITRPDLTLPPAEAAVLRAAYHGATCILEYGSGGSTVMAGEMPGKRVLSVESAQDWAQMMGDWFAANPPVSATRVEILWSDIGATKDWGYPVDDSQWRSFGHYPLQVWQRADCTPDVVLVDGRFRSGCALATAFMTRKPVDLLFDDYVHRTHYHKVEELLGAPKLTGRMAQFRVTPQPIPPARLLWLMRLMQTP